MDLRQLINQLRASITPRLEERRQARERMDEIRALAVTEERAPTEDEAAEVVTLNARVNEIDAEVERVQGQIDEYEEELRRDEAADRLAREAHPAAPSPTADRTPSGVRVGNEPRQYSADNDPKGIHFLRDVALSFMGNFGAGERLNRHMEQEIVERAAAGRPLVERELQTGPNQDRAVGTSAFSGLVVPQYLTDLVAPHAKAGRPFADFCRHHDLPEQGMTVNISKITTGTDTGVQTNEGDAATEQNIDDTLLTVPVKTNTGQQTVSRQAVERGTGIEDTTLEDLFRSHGTRIDATLLNEAATGMTNVATAISYTDATPTAAELYPKLLQAPSAAETALLDMDPGDLAAVMHSRRWFWLQSQLSSTWPLFGQPQVPAQLSGVNYGERYGSGFRGVLPNGTPVIVDNNIATNLGAGVNEDEIYFGAQSECHLWEDPSAPMLIRAEQPKAANLQILLVVYSYFAYTFTRRAHAQKINGTGLVTPTF